MRALRILAIVVVLLFVSHGTGADAPFSNDAGSGRDAGDSPATAVMLSSFSGPWAGVLSHSDVDTFGFPSLAGPACVKAVVGGEKQGIAELSLGSSSAALPFAASTVQLSVASSGAGTPWLEVLNPLASAGPSSYQFTAARYFPSTNGDAATGTDAGTGAAALPVTEGCIGGTVGGIDQADEFVLDVPADRVVVLSIASTSPGLAVDVLAPTGQLLATVASGEILDFGTLEAGRYVLSASSSSLSADGYVVGLIFGPPGCKPNC